MNNKHFLMKNKKNMEFQSKNFPPKETHLINYLKK